MKGGAKPTADRKKHAVNFDTILAENIDAVNETE